VHGKQQIVVRGNDFDLLGTCPRCNTKTSLLVENGELVVADVTFKDDNAPDDDENPPDPVDPPKDGEGEALEEADDKNEHGDDDDDDSTVVTTTVTPPGGKKQYTTKT